MVASDPFQPRSKWRVLLPLSATAAVGVLLTLMGVVSTPAGGVGADGMRMAVLQDHYLLQRAVRQYVQDTRALPASSFDISEDSPCALSDARLVPLAEQDAWRGPYLHGGLSRPTAASFWSLAEPGSLGPDQAGAAWARLHRGYGEIDDTSAQYFDRILDDGDLARGDVRVTDTWIWFKLADLSPSHPASSAAR
jgi:hypothetical protein